MSRVHQNAKSNNEPRSESGAAVSSTAVSPLPINYTLAGDAVQKLLSLHRTITSHSSDALTPIKLAEKVLAMVTLMDHVKGGPVPENELELATFRDELEDAPMESLSPELQELKRGFEHMPIDPASPKGIERRINEALRAGGETEYFKIVHGAFRIDTSTVPPSRVPKSGQDHNEQQRRQLERCNDLRARKPQLYLTVGLIMSELFNSLPRAQPQSLPAGTDMTRGVSLAQSAPDWPLAYLYLPPSAEART